MKRQRWNGMLLLIVTFLLFFPIRGGAAEKLMDADFICQSVAIGDEEAKAAAVFGEPIYEKNVCIEGVFVKECDYAGDFTIGIARSTGKVIDIISKGKQYTVRNGIRYGATPGWIAKTYGKVPRTMLDGNFFYIYTNPKEAFQHLMLQVDSEDGHLTAMRITGLPMNEEERNEMRKVHPELFEEPEDSSFAIIPSGDDIDISALPKAETVKLGGLTE